MIVETLYLSDTVVSAASAHESSVFFAACLKYQFSLPFPCHSVGRSTKENDYFQRPRG
jgi:hypothetical protein